MITCVLHLIFLIIACSVSIVEIGVSAWELLFVHSLHECLCPYISPLQDQTPVNEEELCDAWSKCKCKTVNVEIVLSVSDVYSIAASYNVA